jgi:hypothetical protein
LNRAWREIGNITFKGDERRETDGDEMAIAVLTILPAEHIALQQYCELIEDKFVFAM